MPPFFVSILPPVSLRKLNPRVHLGTFKYLALARRLLYYMYPRRGLESREGRLIDMQIQEVFADSTGQGGSGLY